MDSALPGPEFVCYKYFLVILVKVRQFLKLDSVWACEMRCTLNLRIRDAFVAMILQWAFPFKIFYQTDGYVKGEISSSMSRLIYATF